MNSRALVCLLVLLVAGCESYPKEGDRAPQIVSDPKPDGVVAHSNLTDEPIAKAPEFPHGYPDVKLQSIAQAIDILNVAIIDTDKDAIRQMSQDDLITLQFSLGMWIRNNFGFWSGNNALLEELGNPHPDEASEALIEAYWRHLNTL